MDYLELVLFVLYLFTSFIRIHSEMEFLNVLIKNNLD